MDLQGLIHNRWAMGGVAVAAAAGGYVLYRRSKAGGSGGSSTDAGSMAQNSAGYAGGPGTFDSTGTDVAAWLSDYSGGLQNQLNQGLAAYQQQLTDALAGLATVPTAGAPGGTGVTLPHPTVPPHKPPPNKSPQPRYVTTVPYTSGNTPWNSTLSGIARHYNTTVGALLKLNPKIKNPNVIGSKQQIRVG